MPKTAADFLKAAAESGILPADSLMTRVGGIDADTAAKPLADRLVQQGLLTSFQADRIANGEAQSLVLGPYVVLDLLGRGGMGCVYKAEHRKMRRVVALKVIASPALDSGTAVLRFEREVQAAARLEHPNIVTAHDAGEADGTHYLVMQYVDGRNLAEVVQAAGPQSVGSAVDWVLQAARGLAFAHEQGVVHRDIKPGNLLIDARGTVKVLDMGLARLATLGADQDQLTGTGQIMGTADYMAPEQAMDTRQADARSDVYSLGVTLWYLLTGRPLFGGDSVINRIMAHVQAPVPSLGAVRPDVSSEVQRLFERMVAKRPEDRFQSMRDLIDAIEALPPGTATAGPPGGPVAVATASGGGASGNAARPGPTSPGISPRQLDAGPVVARGRGLVTSAAVAAGVLLAGIAMVALRGGRATTPPAPRAAVDDDRTAAVPTAPAATVSPFDGAAARRHQEEWARHLGIDVETMNSIGATLVLIPPGRFTMGQRGGPADETPYAVTLTTPYLLGSCEVTNAQWARVMGSSPATWQDDDRPVENVHWKDAVEFCRKLSDLPEERQAKRVYRLPTEAEWEYACRAGTTTKYSFGDEESRLGDHGWYLDNGGSETHPVGLMKPNPWGLFDMHGNVWEWCSDWKHDYPKSAATDPRGASRGSDRVRRSGSWESGAGSCRSAHRIKGDPATRNDRTGFRVALQPPGVHGPESKSR